MKKNIIRLSATLMLMVLGGILAAQASESDQAKFYRGRTIKLLVGNSAGGGYDLYSRTLARHLSKHMPGHPTVVVQNVSGAGSLVLTNQIANTLPRDGTVFGSVARGMAFEPLLKNQQAHYKSTDLNWLGSLNNETSICVAWGGNGIKTWQDLKTQPMTIGSTGAGSDTNLFPRVLRDLFGLKFKIISGYPGGNEINLAMERGEVQGRCGWSWSSAKATHPKWFARLKDDSDTSKVNMLLQMSLKKNKDLPDVTLVTDLAENKKQTQVLRLLFARQVMGRPFVAPPGVPKERLATLRRAITETANDPEFIEDANNQSLGINFVSGEEIQDIVNEAYEYPDDVIQFIRDAQS